MNDIEKMCREHFNEPILIFFDVGRLVGYAEDQEDCYLIVKYPAGHTQLISAVGGYIFLDILKGQDPIIPIEPSFKNEIWDDFYRLDTLLINSGVPHEKEFILKI